MDRITHTWIDSKQRAGNGEYGQMDRQTEIREGRKLLDRWTDREMNEQTNRRVGS